MDGLDELDEIMRRKFMRGSWKRTLRFCKGAFWSIDNDLTAYLTVMVILGSSAVADLCVRGKQVDWW